MDVTFFLQNLSKREEETFKDYVNEKTPAIASLLTKFADDAQLLKATIEKFEKHDAYEVEFCLALPTKTIVAKEASHNINKAVDLSKDRLVSQLKKHMALLRKDRSHQTIRKPELVKEVVEVWE
jgi:ribosome-associated translation inhibitor RaiA